MRVYRSFSVLMVPMVLSAASCWAAEVATPAPVVPAAAATAASAPEILDLTVADGARLLSHWNASIYAKVWNDVSMAKLHTELDSQCAAIVAKTGLDLRVLLPAMGVLHVAVLNMTLGPDEKPLPQVVTSCTFGDQAATIMKAVIAANQPLTVVGADQAALLTVSAPYNRLVLARFGSQLVLSLNTDPHPQQVLADPVADLRVHLDMHALMGLLAKDYPDAGNDVLKTLTENPNIGRDYIYDATIVPEGVLEHFSQQPAAPLGAPVDRSVLGQLPGTTLLCLGYGVDGKLLWKTNHDMWMADYAMTLTKQQGHPVSPAEAEEQINKMIAEMNVPVTLQQAVEGLTGTMLLAIGQGIPVPTVTLALPRSKALDALVDYGLKLMNVETPAEGASAMLPIPNVPVSVNLIRDAKHWVLSSDPSVTTGWSTGQAGGWADSPAGKLALAKAPESAVLIGSSDTPAVIHAVSGYLGMYLSTQKGAQAEQSQLLLVALNKLAAIASTGYVYTATAAAPSATVSESRGMLGVIGLPVLAGLAAYPRAMGEAAGAASETEASNRLKTLILPAETTFQAKAYLDQNADGIGEYALLSELGGLRTVTGAPALSLIPKDLAAGLVDGWRYAVYLPDDKGGSIDEPDAKADPRAKDPTAATFQERRWVAYAWPDTGNSSKHMFAILPDGIVRVAPFDEDAPEWSDVFGGGTWDAKPIWQPLGH